MRRTMPFGWLVCSVLLFAVALLTPTTSHAAEQGWLGVSTQELSSDLRSGLDYDGDGVLVTRVVEDSPAARAGLRKGDILVSFNSRTIASPDQLRELVTDAGPGRTVALRIVRDGEKRTLSAELAARDEDESTPSWKAPTPPTPPVAPRAPRTTWSREAPKADTETKVYRKTWKSDGNGEPEVHIWKDGKEVDPEDMDDHLKGLMGDMHIEGLEGMEGMHGLGDGKDKRIVIRSQQGRNGMQGMQGMQSMGRGRLGVRIESLNPDLASALGAGSERGVLVLEVLGGTPAEKAGIKAGDIIVSVGREAVSDADDLVSTLRDEDGAVSIGVVRRGVKRTIDATLEDAPRVMRFKSGDGQLGMGRLREMERPRVRIERDTDRDGLREELEKLRSELRDLKRELEDSKR